jgi:hypothetical protein
LLFDLFFVILHHRNKDNNNAEPDSKNKSQGHEQFNMRAIKNLNDFSVILVNDNDIQQGCIHDCYGPYGQKIDSYDAGDWCFDQPDFRDEAKREAEKQLGEIEWDDFDLEVIGDKEVEVNADDENAEKALQIQIIMSKWAEENYHAMEGVYLNYWDGHNMKSIILSDEFNESQAYELLDDDEAQEYIDIYDKADFGQWSDGYSTAVVDEYKVVKSCWEGSFEIATILLNEEEED